MNFINTLHWINSLTFSIHLSLINNSLKKIQLRSFRKPNYFSEGFENHVYFVLTKKKK